MREVTHAHTHTHIHMCECTHTHTLWAAGELLAVRQGLKKSPWEVGRGVKDLNR